MTHELCQREPVQPDSPPQDLGPISPASAYLASLSPGSRRTMTQSLQTMATLAAGVPTDPLRFAWHLLRHAHVAALRARLAEDYAPATANKMLAALRGTLLNSWRLGLLTGEEYQRAIDVPAVPGSTLPRGRALAGHEMQALLDACSPSDSAAARRDRALVALLYGAGLRRAEVVALDVADYVSDTGELRVQGKGNKYRRAYLGSGGPVYLNGWLVARGTHEGPLLLPITRAGRLMHRRLTEQAIYTILARRGQQAGLARFSPHDLRRSFVSDLLDAGADISLVQQLAGHAQVTTTARYDRRTDQARQQAARLLQVPRSTQQPTSH